LKIIENAKFKVHDLKEKIRQQEPELQKFETDLTKQNEELNIIIAETRIKCEEVTVATENQNKKVEELTKMTEQIKIEKFDCEKEKEDALKLAEKLSNRDITEISSYIQPPDNISYCMKIIVLLFDEEKEMKGKDELPLWFSVAKKKLLSNVNEFKERLKSRIQREDITKKQ